MFTATLLVLFIFPFAIGQANQFEEECNILQTLEDLKNRLTSSEADIANLQSSHTTALNQINQQHTEIANLQSSHTTALNQINQQHTEIATLTSSLAASETKIELQGEEIGNLTDYLDSAEAAIEMLKATQKDPPLNSQVFFHVNNITKGPIYFYDNITFFNILENKGDAYNLTSGCFIAPIRGVYWFTAHICTDTNELFTPAIVVRGNITSKVQIRDDHWPDCGSVSTVTSLEENDEVCLQAGGCGTGPDGIVTEYPSLNTNDFMGALIN